MHAVYCHCNYSVPCNHSVHILQWHLGFTYIYYNGASLYMEQITWIKLLFQPLIEINTCWRSWKCNLWIFKSYLDTYSVFCMLLFWRLSQNTWKITNVVSKFTNGWQLKEGQIWNTEHAQRRPRWSCMYTAICSVHCILQCTLQFALYTEWPPAWASYSVSELQVYGSELQVYMQG